MKTTATIFLLFISIYLFNQNLHYQWVKQYESLPGKLMFDANQNPVFAITYQDTMFFEGDTFPSNPHTSDINSGLYLKFDKNGDYNDPIRFPYTSWGHGIDSDNNYYFSGGPHGYYLDTLYIGNDSIVLDNNDSIRSYIVQYDSVGSYNWHKKIYATDYLSHCVHVYNGTTDNQDNFYVHGSGSYIRFETDTTFQYKKFASLYLAKYHKDGSLRWAKQLGPLVTELSFDHNNNPFIYGDFYNSSLDTILIENDTLINSNGENIIAKLDTNGNLIWYKQYDLRIKDVHISQTDGSIFILGRVDDDTLIIGNDTLLYPQYTQTFGSPSYHYLAKFSNDHVLQWSKTIEGGFNSNMGTVNTDSDDRVIVNGMFSDTLMIDNIYAYQNYPTYTGIFLTMLSEDGNAQWIKVYDEYRVDRIENLEIDDNNNIYMVYRPSTLNSGDTVVMNQFEIIMNDNTDALFVKINAFNTFIDNVEHSDIVSIYPNPTNGMVSVKLPGTDQGFTTKVNVYDINGQLIKSVQTDENMFEIDLRYEVPGIYVIRFNNPDFNEVHKIIKH